MKDLTRVLDVYMHATAGSKSWLLVSTRKSPNELPLSMSSSSSTSSWRTRFLPAKTKQNLIAANLRTKKEELPGLDLGTNGPRDHRGEGGKTALTDMD